MMNAGSEAVATETTPSGAPAPTALLADEPVSGTVARRPAPVPTLAFSIEGLSTLVSALGAVVVSWRLTQTLGFVDEQHREAMMPFNLSPPTNTLFQYAVGLVVALAVLVLYARGVAPRLGHIAQRLELLVGTTFLLLAALTPWPRMAVAALALRAAAGAWLALRGKSIALQPGRPLARLAAWAPLTGLLVCAGGFALVLPSGMSAAVRNAPAWVLLVGAAPVALFFVEEALPEAALPWERRIGVTLGLVAIPWLTFRVAAAYFDYATIVGPVNDLLHGKDILDGVVSTYGFLFTYALASVFWLFHVSDPFQGTAVMNALAFTIGYGAILLFLAHRIQRVSLVLASMALLLAVHFYHLHVPQSWLPQSGFLRFGGLLPIFLLLYAWPARAQSRRFEWAIAACSALAILWTIEVGMYIVAGLAAALSHQVWFRVPGDRRAFRLIGKTAACIGLLLGCVALRILLRHGHGPVWADLLHFQRALSAGLAMSPVTSIERWPMPILIYLATLCVALRAGRTMRHATAWVFLAGFGLVSMVYPLGKAGIWDLGRVVLPAVLLTAAFVGFLFQTRETSGSGTARADGFDVPSLAPLAWFGVVACALCFVQQEVSPQVAMSTRLELSHQKPIAHDAPSWQGFLPAADSRARFQQDLAAIHALVPPDAALPILSRNDTLYYVFGERKSLFKNSFYPHFFFKSDIEEIARNLEASDVGYLFVDNSGFQIYENRIDTSIGTQVRDRIGREYRFVKHAGFLDVYQRTAAAVAMSATPPG
jgi:hypothetical protein